MKRFTMIVALMLMVAMPMIAERVTPETAQKVAKTFLNNNGVKSAQLTCLTSAAGFSNLYIFSGEEGFVVMAADDCVQPILGYSLTGEFVAEGMPENIRGWLQGYNDEIQYAIDNKLSATTETTQLWKALTEGKENPAKTTIIVAPLIQTIWDQGSPFNNLCPADAISSSGHAVTGCAATAMAQVMNYWEHPTRGTGSHSYSHSSYGQLSANFGNTVYDWDNMRNSYSNNYSETEANAVATLMYHCGVAINMDYGPSASGAYSEDVRSGLVNYFGYSSSTSLLYKSSYTNTNWISMLKNELNNKRPLYYSGNSNSGGHAFVCDGYDNNNNFHFNWGWSSYCDGYFTIGALNPGTGGTGSGSGQYNLYNAALFGCQPNTPSINPPTIAVNVDGRDVSITWNSVSDAASYKLYRNGNLIASALTGTSYSDNDLPYGDHAYYVKSVKSDGTMSLKSNTAIANIHFGGPIPTNLNASLNNSSVNVTWTAPTSESAILQYGTGNLAGSVGYNGSYEIYWAQRYPVSTLTPYAGMAINKVSVYFRYSGTYTLYIYNGNELGVSDLMYQLSYTASSTGWNDINISNPVVLDYSNDLWVVMYAPAEITYPAAYCNYSNNGVENAAYYSTSGSGWNQWGDNNRSWMMKTYISDDTYTYTLYDGTTSVASNISGTSYTINNITNNTAHQYTVKTNYYGTLSDASNMAGLTIGTASLSTLNLDTNDKMTITKNSKLIVSGTLSDVSTTNLVLEDGAQLSHNSANVQATVKNNITAYTNSEDGWYFIASPIMGSITPNTENGLLTNSYDLYKFDQSEDLEWRNYRDNGFNLDNGKGYLYANLSEKTLNFTGQLNASNTEISIPISYTNSPLAGLNLVGNPFACNAYLIDENHEIMPFYRMNDTGNTIVAAQAGTAIKPCEGVFVICPNDRQTHSAVFTTTIPQNIGEAQNVPQMLLPIHDLLVNQDASLTNSMIQTTMLTEGWNWWSTYLDIELSELEDALGTVGISIKSQDGLTSYSQQFGWIGEVEEVVPEQMYKIHVSQDCSFALTGEVINPADHGITIKNGSNWIGYPVGEPMTLQAAFANFTPANGDVIRTASGLSTYSSIMGAWIGDIESLEPGQGYIYISKASSNKTLIFPSASK